MSNKNNKKATLKEVFLYGAIDERTKTVINKGDALMGRFILFVILLDVIIRSFVKTQFKDSVAFFDNNWDLMLIVIFGGMFSTLYQLKHKVFSGSIIKNISFIILIILISALVAFVIRFIF